MECLFINRYYILVSNYHLLFPIILKIIKQIIEIITFILKYDLTYKFDCKLRNWYFELILTFKLLMV